MCFEYGTKLFKEKEYSLSTSLIRESLPRKDRKGKKKSVMKQRRGETVE